MIHYTLLPEKEIRTLKREYRTRLIIILIFFVSFAVVVGISSLIPAYVFSSLQEKEARDSLETIRRERGDKEVEAVLADLTALDKIVESINNNKSPIITSDVIGVVISQRTPGVKLTSFQFTEVKADSKKSATSTVQVVIQGKANDRDTLINFKNNLELTPLFSMVELPISDLTKSKDIPFSVRLSIIKPQ